MYKKLFFLLTSIILMGCNDNRVLLETSVSQTSANDIILILGQANIVATKEIQKDGKFTLFVPLKQQLQALALLKSRGEPSENFTTIGEVFKKDGFISSPLEEHARFTYALNQEISNMLSSFNGVVSVRTQVSLPIPSDNLWQSDSAKPSVAVFIKYRQGEHLDLYTTKIKNLISKAVPGVTTDNVEVLMIAQKDNAATN